MSENPYEPPQMPCEPDSNPESTPRQPGKLDWVLELIFSTCLGAVLGFAVGQSMFGGSVLWGNEVLHITSAFLGAGLGFRVQWLWLRRRQSNEFLRTLPLARRLGRFIRRMFLQDR